MSWGALPWWVFQLAYEHDLARMSCAFPDEWFSGTHKDTPPHVVDISMATFKTWDVGGWNFYKTEESKTQ